MLMQGRTVILTGVNYRYGFNAQENDDEVKGQSNSMGAEFWEYDNRSGRRWNIDPKTQTGVSPYAAFSNSPIWFCDPLGDTSVIGAGGTQKIDIDEKANSLQFYGATDYSIKGTKTNIPVQQGQLRSFTNALGTFSASWTTDANGKAVFAGYLNDKNQTLDGVAQEITSSWKYKLWNFGEDQMRAQQKDPVGYNLKFTVTLLTISAMSAAEPAPYSGSYNPSVTTQESMSALGTLKSAPSYAEGTFSIFNWRGYPNWGVKPAGPFRLLEGAEYTTARTLANRTNAAIHNSAPYLKSLQIHEITPIKFGGSPTDAANKLFLTPEQHSEYTNFWNDFMRSFKK